MIFFIWIQTQSNLTEIRSYFYLHGQSNINLMKTLWLSEALLRPRPDIFESATFPFRVRLPSTRIRRIRPAYISATFWLRSPEWKCLALLSTWNRMDAKSGYFFFFFFFLSGDVTRSSPLLYREYCIWDGNLDASEETWVLEWIRIRVGHVQDVLLIRSEYGYVWTWKFLNPERKSCGFKNIRVRVNGALVFLNRQFFHF